MGTTNQNAQDEYKELNENHRFYGNIRFAQLTLFSAIIAALLTVLFNAEPRLEGFIRIIMKALGLLVTVVFFILEYRSTYYGTKIFKRMQALENILGYDQWKSLHHGRDVRISSTNAVSCLYKAIFVFWVLSLIYHSW